MIIYKIRNKNGEFSTGGSRPSFSKAGGKSWNRLQDVKTHLSYVHGSFNWAKPYETCELVKYEVTEIEIVKDIVL